MSWHHFKELGIMNAHQLIQRCGGRKYGLPLCVNQNPIIYGYSILKFYLGGIWLCLNYTIWKYIKAQNVGKAVGKMGVFSTVGGNVARFKKFKRLLFNSPGKLHFWIFPFPQMWSCWIYGKVLKSPATQGIFFNCVFLQLNVFGQEIGRLERFQQSKIGLLSYGI